LDSDKKIRQLASKQKLQRIATGAVILRLNGFYQIWGQPDWQASIEFWLLEKLDSYSTVRKFWRRILNIGKDVRINHKSRCDTEFFDTEFL